MANEHQVSLRTTYQGDSKWRRPGGMWWGLPQCCANNQLFGRAQPLSLTWVRVQLQWSVLQKNPNPKPTLAPNPSLTQHLEVNVHIRLPFWRHLTELCFLLLRIKRYFQSNEDRTESYLKESPFCLLWLYDSAAQNAQMLHSFFVLVVNMFSSGKQESSWSHKSHDVASAELHLTHKPPSCPRCDIFIFISPL